MLERAPSAVLLATLLFLGAACGPERPEDQVRKVIEEAEVAAEAGDLAALGELVSANYRDALGNDRRQALALLAYRVRVYRSVHLLVKVRTIHVAEPGAVEASVVVAAAGVPLPDPGALDRVPADLLHFDLRFIEEERGGWKLIRAEWRKADAADFL